MQPALSLALVVLCACAGTPAVNPNPGAKPMEGSSEIRNVTVSIRRSPADVYAFVTRGENLPRWASGLGKSIQQEGDAWLAEGPLGKVRVRFAPPNELGVADHEVTLDTGIRVNNPLRVIPNGTGSSVIFTLLRGPDVSQKQFDADAATVERDLTTLKTLLEQ